jgi:hypothetical protein
MGKIKLCTDPECSWCSRQRGLKFCNFPRDLAWYVCFKAWICMPTSHMSIIRCYVEETNPDDKQLQCRNNLPLLLHETSGIQYFNDIIVYLQAFKGRGARASFWPTLVHTYLQRLCIRDLCWTSAPSLPCFADISFVSVY